MRTKVMINRFRSALAAATLLVCAACSSTAVQTDLTALNSDLATLNSTVLADANAVAAQGVPALCVLATPMDGLFQVAAAFNKTVAAQAATEKSVYAVISGICANPPTNAAQAVAQLVPAVQQMQDILKPAATAPAATPAPAAAPAPVAAPSS
jgi:hypothetical protein